MKKQSGKPPQSKGGKRKCRNLAGSGVLAGLEGGCVRSGDSLEEAAGTLLGGRQGVDIWAAVWGRIKVRNLW